MGKRKLLILTAALTAVTVMHAAPRTAAQMKQTAAHAINELRAKKRLSPKNISDLKTLRAEQGYQLMAFEGQKGFAVVSTDDLLPELLGVSATPYSEGRNKNFETWLKATAAAAQYVAAHGVKHYVTKPDPDKFPAKVEPMVTTKWDQEAPYDGMCPTYSGQTKCLTGCVATAMAQILKYHETPEHGQGQRTIYYPQSNHNGQAVTADFEEDYYDWPNMLDSYTPGNYTQVQGDAVALLMRDCGVAANMEYGGPNDGSGAFSTDAALGLRQYFGFEDAECLERDYYSESAWMEMIYRELSENGPLYYGGADYYYGGHAFVFDGYREDGMVSVNWGWSGDEDGWYQVSILNPGYYSWQYQQDMIIGIKSDNHAGMQTVNVELTATGELQTHVEAELEEDKQVGTLTVSGPLNAADLDYVKQLAAEGLRTLDISKATLEDNALPESFLAGSPKLQRVRLPETLETIGRQAFSGCSSLSEVRVPTRQVPTLGGANVFEGLPFGMARLFVRSGLKTKYSQTAQWKEFGKDNIIEFGTSLKVRNVIRKYGEENPAFTYSVSGDPVEGTPELTCEATAASPAGRYPIVITAGTVTADDVDYIDGYLVVQQVEATATVDDATREVGQPNPAFTMSYTGLVNDDVVPIWLEGGSPVFTTEADENSPVGEYPITVTASAESYQLTFVAGTLTVTAATTPTGISQLSASGEQQATSYTDLSGRRMEGAPLTKGIYIRQGRKYVVK